MNGSVVHRDLVYSTVMGFRPLTLDLRVPGPASGAAIIVFVHGGGWRTGSKVVFTPTIGGADSFERMIEAGFAVASVDYRLSGEASFPAQVDDVRAALRWVRDNANEYGFDASRVILWGESAGATIASLVALEPDAGVRAVIDWYGPSNLISLAESQTPDVAATSREAEWLGTSALDNRELARSASPVFAVHDSAPAFYISHGTADEFVPYSQSEEFAAALATHGADVRLAPVDGANHMWRGVADAAALVGPALDFARELAGR